VLAVTAICGAGYYLYMINQRGELASGRVELEMGRQKVDQLQARKETLRRDFDKQEEELRHFASLTESKKSLELQAFTLDKELVTARAELLAAVQWERANAVGTVIPELRLADGQILKVVKIQSVDDTEMVASHVSGVARIALGRLPLEMKQRFRADVTSVTSSESVPTIPSTGTTTPISAETTTAAPTSTQEQLRLRGLKRLVQNLQDRIAGLERLEQNSKIAPNRVTPPESTDVNQRAQQIAQEEKRMNDIAKAIEEQSTRRSIEIDELKAKIAQLQAEIAKIEKGLSQ
jgi:DNA repair exonuclease SbcCD ATPase subunit